MEVLTSDFTINEIIDFDKSSLDTNRVILWIWHADKIPPHVGLSSEGKYFSLKSSGKDFELPVSQVIQLVERKGIKTLAVELEIESNLTELATVFNEYSTTKSNEITCLTPIKDILNHPAPTKLKYLLNELGANEEIGRIVGFNIDETFEGIPNYSVEDIHCRLELLERGS